MSWNISAQNENFKHDYIWLTGYGSFVGSMEQGGTVIDFVKSSIFPNPSNGLVLLQTEQNLPPDSHFKIYDQSGRLVFEKELQSGFDKQNIEMYDLSNGMYFYEILLSGFVIGNGKLVINKRQ